jgi:hypothetical protein
MVSVAREIEVKEKGEGSLSIPIVPLESWEISSTESQWVGKGKHRRIFFLWDALNSGL